MGGYRRAAALLSVATVTLSLSVVQQAPAIGVSSPTLAVRNVAPVRGEAVTLYGALPTRFVRTVLVQYQAGGSWHSAVSLRTSGSGTYSWSTHASASRNYRVLAPATRHRHKKVAATASPGRTITVVGQSGTLTTSTTAGQSTLALRARFRPARPGRLVSLQRQVGASWTTVSSGRESSTGEVAYTYSPTHSTAPSTTSLRALAVAAGGATSAATPVLGVQNPVDAPTPPDLPDPGSPVDALASVDNSGVSLYGGSSCISDDGNLVAFTGSYRDAPNGQQGGGIFVRDLAAGTTRQILSSPDSAGNSYPSGSPVISGNGRYVIFTTADPGIAAQRESGTPQVVRYDLATGTTDLVSTPTLAGQDVLGGAQPSISTDGSRITFVGHTQVSVGETTNRLYVRDMNSADGWVVPDPPGVISWGKSSPAISGNGRFVAYLHTRPKPGADPNEDSVPLRFDVFRYDLQTQATDAVSVNSAGNLANANSSDPAISSDGGKVSFASSASDIVPGSIGGYRPYVRDMAAGTTRSRPGDQGVEGKLLEETGTLSGDGSTLAALWFDEPCANAWCAKQLRIYDLGSGDYRAVSDIAGTQYDTITGIQLTADGRYGVYTLRGQVHRFDVLGFPPQ